MYDVNLIGHVPPRVDRNHSGNPHHRGNDREGEAVQFQTPVYIQGRQSKPGGSPKGHVRN